ncbi:matrixin family metalloprotease [Fibrella aquatilis]|uniref:Peptidase M10 metallopeptidase domain-containing protein n=1 Tax=Fibrella aquatilis TaxID=2817059 RepID=A0A939K2Z7_9BACT|nr:matrixin family metalloprotease [Fibrella aquatilis]MBO0933835.1 hypothetical protein [Fibrella aquatilis]
MKTTVIWAYFALLTVGSCLSDEPPTATPIYQISDYERANAARQFEGCTVRYAFRNQSKRVKLSTLQKELEVPFDRWGNANGFLVFVPVPAEAEAEISIIFADTLRAKPGSTIYGLIRQPTGPLSVLERAPNKTCTIYLLDTHPWDAASLQRVLLFQIGAALGLATSSRPSSAMNGQQLTSVAALDTGDVSAVRRVYDKPCDQWRKLRNKRFQFAIPFVVQSRAFVMAPEGLWEYLPATDSWEVRRTYPQAVFSSGTWPQAIELADRALVGTTYETSPGKVGQPGLFWAYLPATNDWKPIAPLPQKGFTRSMGATLGQDGYVLTTLNTQTISPLVVWKYDPQADQWSQPAAWRYAPWVNFGASVDVVAVALKNQLYVWLQKTSQRSLRFDPALPTPWVEIDSPPEVGTASSLPGAFAVRDYAYCLLGNGFPTTNVLRYSPSLGWKQLADFPSKGNASYSFVLNNRAYVGTTGGELWEYTP